MSRFLILAVALAALAAVVAGELSQQSQEELLKTQMEALLPGSSADLQTREADGKFRVGPVRRKLKELERKLERELKDLLAQKNNMASALAAAKLKYENSIPVLQQAGDHFVNVTTPEKEASDYEVIRIQAQLTQLIYAAKRQISFHNLEKAALYAQIRFARKSKIVRNRIVNVQNQNLASMSVEELEESMSAESLDIKSAMSSKETKLSKKIRSELNQMIQRCLARLEEIKGLDAAKDQEVKTLQATYSQLVEENKVLTQRWKDARKAYNVANRQHDRAKGMYEELLRLSGMNTEPLEDKIRVLQEELALVRAMIGRVDQYKADKEAEASKEVKNASKQAAKEVKKAEKKAQKALKKEEKKEIKQMKKDAKKATEEKKVEKEIKEDNKASP